MIVSSCVMIIGKLMFGFILGNVASEIFNWNKNLIQFKEKIIAIKVSVTLEYSRIYVYNMQFSFITHYAHDCEY